MKSLFKDLKQVSNTSWFIALFSFLARYLSGLLFRWLVYGSFRFVGLDFLFCVLFGLLVYIISSLLGPRVRKAFFVILLLIMALLFISQFLYFQLFKTLYTVYSMFNSLQILEFYRDILNLILDYWWALIVFLIPFGFVVVVTYRAPLVAFRWHRFSLLLVVVGGLLWMSMLMFIHAQEEGNPSLNGLYHRDSQVFMGSDKFGLLTAMRVDVRNYFFPSKADVETDPVVVIPTPSTPPLETEVIESPNEPEVIREPWVLDIDFDKLSSSTKNETLQKMDQYFSQINPTYTNEYTGIAEGFNLIFITAEAYSRFSVDPELTPTLYMMQEQGLKFTNFYNPVWSVSTSDGEYVGVTGLIPKNGVWSLAVSGQQKNDLAFTYGNLLRRYGYHTMAFHNHTFNYYKRDISHPNMGYEYMGIGNGLNIRKTWPESDIDLMLETMDKYIDKEKFHTYYMTVSGHMGYLYKDNYIATKNRSLVEGLAYQTEEAKAYMATQIEFDRAMEVLLDTLREKGLAEKTLIVVNADHYPYGLPKESIDELAGETVEENFELYRGSLLVYFDGMTPATIDKYSSSLDVLPTIYNLMNMPFDSRLLAGRDILSDEPSLVIFVNRSWISDLGRYNALTKVFSPNPGVEVPDHYVTSMNRLVAQRFDYSRLILETDYYRHFNTQAIWPELD